MNVKEKNNNEILLLSHELSRTGAPIVLRNLAVVLKEMGYSVLVVSFRDGELKEDYEKNDIPIMVYDNQDIEPDFIDRLVADYAFVMACSKLCTEHRCKYKVVAA